MGREDDAAQAERVIARKCDFGTFIPFAFTGQSRFVQSDLFAVECADLSCFVLVTVNFFVVNNQGIAERSVKPADSERYILGGVGIGFCIELEGRNICVVSDVVRHCKIITFDGILIGVRAAVFGILDELSRSSFSVVCVKGRIKLYPVGDFVMSRIVIRQDESLFDVIVAVELSFGKFERVNAQDSEKFRTGTDAFSSHRRCVIFQCVILRLLFDGASFLLDVDAVLDNVVIARGRGCR